MKIISINSKIHGGYPCVAGTRIPINALMFLIRKKNLSPEEISKKYYTQLLVETIKEVIKYSKYIRYHL